MRVSPSSDASGVYSRARVESTQRVQPASPGASASGRFGVLNDFRYLTADDAQMLAVATGERLEQGDPRSAFAQQLALDRRTGELGPNQQVTAVYLRNRAVEIDAEQGGRPGFTNPYSGPAFGRAIAFLEASGRGRADIRL